MSDKKRGSSDGLFAEAPRLLPVVIATGLLLVGIALSASSLDTSATSECVYIRADLASIFVGAAVPMALTIPPVAALARARWRADGRRGASCSREQPAGRRCSFALSLGPAC